MMRPMDQDSGFRTIMEGLVEGLLQTDRQNSYLLLYRTEKWLGRFSSFENVEEVLVSGFHKLIWDQVAVPYTAWRKQADIIFNPKFSVPFVSHCPVAMGLHEPAWWVWPEHYEWLDQRYVRTMLPWYCRKAAHLFPISKFVIDENRKYVGLPFDNTTVAYPAPKEYFTTIDDSSALQEFREKYDLPERFIVDVTRVDHPGVEGSKSFFPGKNPETAVRAFALCRDRIPHRLVLAGRRVPEYLSHIGLTSDDLEGVHCIGFVPHEEIPLLYNLAELSLLPSYYESYGMTLVEAMACGCPVVASKTGACAEISAGAALLADPYDPGDFADKILLLLEDDNLRQQLKRKGLERAAYFSWDKTAKVVLNGLTQAIESRR